MQYKISFRSEMGQASIEAAFILPVVLLIIGLTIQPMLYLYTKAMMQEACLEGVRYATTQDKDELLVRYVRRRLESIPPMEIFHSGGQGEWDIEVVRSERSIYIAVGSIMKPIPVLGNPSLLVLPSKEGGLYVEANATCDLSPSWREGDYEEWVEPFMGQ